MSAIISNVHFITRMHEIILNTKTAHQLGTLLKEMQEFTTAEGLPAFIKRIEEHIAEGDDAHTTYKKEDPEILLKTLYLEWKQVQPEDSYIEFLKKLPNVILTHIYTLPSQPTIEETNNYALTVCSLVFAMNKYHDHRSLSSIHGGRFISSVNNVLGLIIKNQTYQFKPILIIDQFSVDQINLIPNNPTSTDRTGFQPVTPEMEAASASTYIKSVSIHGALDALFKDISNLGIVVDPGSTPTVMTTIINQMNMLYYQPVNIGRRFNSSNSAIFIEFDFFAINGVTVLYAFTNSYGLVKSAIVFDSSDFTFKYLFRRDEYVSDGETIPAYEYVVSIHQMTLSERTTKTKYKFLVRHNKQDKMISISKIQGSSNLITLTLQPDRYVTDLVYDLFNIGLVVNSSDKYKMLMTNKIVIYDNSVYPQAHLELFNLV